MSDELARQLEWVLHQLVLPANRTRLFSSVAAASPPGIDAQTYPILRVLERQEPLPAARLAEEIGIDRSGASRYADRLEALGLLNRAPDPRDRRATLLSLSPEGRRLIEELNATLADHLDTVIAAWPDGGAEALIDGLRRLIDGLAPTAPAPAATVDPVSPPRAKRSR